MGSPRDFLGISRTVSAVSLLRSPKWSDSAKVGLHVPGLPRRIVKATVLRLDLRRDGFHKARRMIRERIGVRLHAREAFRSARPWEQGVVTLHLLAIGREHNGTNAERLSFMHSDSHSVTSTCSEIPCRISEAVC
jgi:hypothetical protein